MLRGMEFEVGAGELVILGERNGAGKTTMMRAIIGIIERRIGSVRFAGCELTPAQLQPGSPVGHRLLRPKTVALSPASMSRRTCSCRRSCDWAASGSTRTITRPSTSAFVASASGARLAANFGSASHSPSDVARPNVVSSIPFRAEAGTLADIRPSSAAFTA